jgi:hypothetical protein
MKEAELQTLIRVRSFLINRYNGLDGRKSAGTAVILQKDVAYIIEETIKGLDEVLTNHVNISKN